MKSFKLVENMCKSTRKLLNWVEKSVTLVISLISILISFSKNICIVFMESIWIFKTSICSLIQATSLWKEFISEGLEPNGLSLYEAWVGKWPKLTLSGSSVWCGCQLLITKMAKEKVLDFNREDFLMVPKPSSLGSFG